MNVNNIPFGSQQSHFTGKPDILPGGFTFDKEHQKLSVGDIVSAGTLGICDELNRTIRIIKTARVSNISEDGRKVELCTYPYNDPCFKVGERVYKADCTNVDFSTVPKIEKIKETGVYVLYLSCPIYNPQIQIFAKSETKRPNFGLLHKTKRSKNSERTT